MIKMEMPQFQQPQTDDIDKIISDNHDMGIIGIESGNSEIADLSRSEVIQYNCSIKEA